MRKKISFHNMEHSEPLRIHSDQKLNKILDVLKEDKIPTPVFLELWLKAFKTHPHHGAEIHLKTPRFDLHAHDECTEMYVAVDNAIDKIIALYKKMKNKTQDKKQKAECEKKEFTEDEDKYTLS